MNSTKARSWIATLQVVPGDYKLEDFLQCQYSNTPDCVYVCGQLEKGSHYHIQYFMAFSTQKRLAAMKKVCPQTHWEPVVRNNGADDYCMKEDTRVEGPFEFGTKPIRQNKKRDMKARNKEILRLGPVEAVKEGLIDVCKFRQAVSSITLY